MSRRVNSAVDKLLQTPFVMGIDEFGNGRIPTTIVANPFVDAMISLREKDGGDPTDEVEYFLETPFVKKILALHSAYVLFSKIK